VRGASPVRESRAALFCGRCSAGLFCVFTFSVSLLFLFPLFAVLLNCPYPDPPVSARFFPFSSALRWGEGRPRGAFVAGRSQTITLCFLHHSEDLLTSTQEASLLQTLCIGPYLDVQKTAFWLQELMTAACTLVPHMDTYKLMVLPSTHYCKIKMTSIFEKSRSIELVLGVQHGDSDTFVCLE